MRSAAGIKNSGTTSSYPRANINHSLKGRSHMKSIVLLVGLLSVVLTGCEQKKVEPVPVGEMNEYRDPGYGFKIKYPKDWLQLGTTGKAVFAKSQEVVDKFQNPQTGLEGAMVTAEVIRFEGKPAADIIAASKEDLKQ